jgi:hypothetical protein
MSIHGGKVSYSLTRKYNSLTLTCEMMALVGMPVDEIVTTRDNALMYVYIHLLRKTRKDALEKAIKGLPDKGEAGTNIFGYNEIDGTSHALSELIEDHPGFRILVRHQEEGNPNFNQWTAAGYGTNSGYNKLKNTLLSRRTAPNGGVGGDGGAVNDEDEEQSPHPRPSVSDGERNKRQKTSSPDGSGQNIGLLKYFWDNVSAEQQRREIAENKLKEVVMKQMLLEQRLAVETEVTGKFQTELLKLRQEHDTQLKAKDKTHADELQAAKEVIIYCFIGIMCWY